MLSDEEIEKRKTDYDIYSANIAGERPYELMVERRLSMLYSLREGALADKTVMAKLGGTEDTPWYWALNGVFGVLSSALAVLFSISFGISVTLYIAAACYAALPLCVRGMRRNARSGIEQLEPSVDLTRETELPPRKVAV